MTLRVQTQDDGYDGNKSAQREIFDKNQLSLLINDDPIIGKVADFVDG